MNIITQSIRNRIKRKGHAWAFTTRDFLDLGAPATVAVILSRLVNAGMIRRIGRGIFDYPEINRRTGKALPPLVNGVAAAVLRSRGEEVLNSPAYEANIQGLSEHVPGQIVFLSSFSRRISLGRGEILVKKMNTGERNLLRYKGIAPIIQALRFMGKDLAETRGSELAAIGGRLDRRQQLQLAEYAETDAPKWMKKHIRTVLEGGGRPVGNPGIRKEAGKRAR